MNDIKFIRDPVQEKKAKELKEILDILSKKPKDMEVESVKRFFYSMLKAAEKISERKKEEAEKEKKIEEIKLKKPPELKFGELRLPSFRNVLKEIRKPVEIPLPIHMPEITLPSKTFIPEELEEPEEPSRIEDAIAVLSETYPLILFKNIKGEAIAKINILHEKGKIKYELTEPEIDFRLVEETKKLIQKKFNKDRKIIKNEKFMTKNIKKAFKKIKIDYTDDYKEEIKYFLYKDMLGLGRIDPFIHDLNINTVICDGVNKPVKITIWPGLEITTNIIYTKKEELDNQIKHLGLVIKKEISENNPMREGIFYNFNIQATLGLGEAESKFIIKRMP